VKDDRDRKMKKKKGNGGKNADRDAQWAEAKRRCRLDDETVRMAREMGLNPGSLIKNIPAPSEPWKAPVRDWIRRMYEKRARKSAAKAARAERGRIQPSPPAATSAPADPSAPPSRDRIPSTADRGAPAQEADAYEGEPLDEHRPFDDPEMGVMIDGPDGGCFEEDELDADGIEEANREMRLRQEKFRRAAEYVARAFSRIPEVRRVVLFGSVAWPLEKEVPRFREFRRRGIPIFHECRDADLAVWMVGLDRLKALYKARGMALAMLFQEQGIGVPHEQVEVFIFDASDRYVGRLCRFKRCPSEREECRKYVCGSPPFLRRDGFVFEPGALDPARCRVLFDRSSPPERGQLAEPAAGEREIPF
jgi:hypothetical protein